MKVKAQALLPKETTVLVKIEATLGELQALQRTLHGSPSWCKTGELLIETIRKVEENLLATCEQLVEVQP